MRHTRLASTLGLGLTIAACGSDFDPQGLLADDRLLALVADAPEPSPDQIVHLRAEVFDPGAPSGGYTWRVCLASLGAPAAYACADPALEFAVEGDGPDLALDLGPAGLDFRRRYAEFGPVAGLDGEDLTLDDGVPLWVKLSGGPLRAGESAVKRLRVRDTDPDTRNHNPGIADLTVNGASTRSGPIPVPADTEVELALTLADDAAERYTDDVTGEDRREVLVYRWFAEGEAPDPESTFDDDRDTNLRTPSVSGDVAFYVVVRDGRGGQSVAGGTLRVGESR
jgi:hypothetical protein